MRMDAYDLPIISASIRHNFPWKLKSYLRLKTSKQLKYYHTQEIDLEASMRFLDHCKLTTIFAYITSDAFDEAKYF